MKKRQMSESLGLAIILALAGGCMDAFTFLFRGTFANVQAGNIVFFGINLAEQKYADAFTFLWPVLAFTVGILVAALIRYKLKYLSFHWRQISLLFEIIVLFGTCFMPHSLDVLSNIFISFACGIQLESFRAVRGNNVATTMCVENLRNGAFNFAKFFQTKDGKYMRRSTIYCAIILAFLVGVVVEGFLVDAMKEWAIVSSVGLLVIACGIMIVKPTDNAEEE